MAIVFIVLEHGQPQCAFRTERAAYAYAEKGKSKSDNTRIVPCELYGESTASGTGIPFDATKRGPEGSHKG